jgi:hypothetical protein
MGRVWLVVSVALLLLLLWLLLVSQRMLMVLLLHVWQAGKPARERLGCRVVAAVVSDAAACVQLGAQMNRFLLLFGVGVWWVGVFPSACHHNQDPLLATCLWDETGVMQPLCQTLTDVLCCLLLSTSRPAVSTIHNRSKREHNSCESRSSISLVMRQASADACCMLRMTTYAWMIKLNAAAVLASRHVPAAEHRGCR